MAILAFQKPENVLMMDATDSYAKFEFRPLEPGYGTTVGNALRRILLSSLEGFAISTIKIEGVNHEFATMQLFHQEAQYLAQKMGFKYEKED